MELSWATLGLSWRHLGAILGHRGRLEAEDIKTMQTPCVFICFCAPRNTSDGKVSAILGPVWAHVGPYWGHRGAALELSGASLGLSWAILGPSWAIVGLWRPKIANKCKNRVFLHVFGHPGTPPTATYQQSWGHIGPILGPIGATVALPSGYLGPPSGYLGPSWGHLGQSEAQDSK